MLIRIKDLLIFDKKKNSITVSEYYDLEDNLNSLKKLIVLLEIMYRLS